MSENLLTELQTSQPNAVLELNKNLTPKYIWNERFCWESERLKTFENWPLEWLDKNILAATGMFYMGVNDHTRCYFCEIIIGKWERTDDPVQEHLRWSPNCSLLQRRTTNNVPINEKCLDLVLPPTKCTTYDTPPTQRWMPIPIHDYSIKNVRLYSFTDWPKSMKQKPEKLVEAGFYYKGIGDSVICFSCLGGLKDWEEDDDPWEQHALWMGHFCPYVKLIKGEEYIKSVYNQFKNDQSKILEQKSKQNQETIILSGSDDHKLCKICFEKDYNTAYVPCGHVVACSECALSVKECPVCRTKINRVVRLYFS